MSPTSCRRALCLAAVAGLLLAVVAVLPLLHDLHHHPSEAPADCPVRLLEQALLLLFVVLVLHLLLLGFLRQRARRARYQVLLVPTRFLGYRHAQRGPPAA